MDTDVMVGFGGKQAWLAVRDGPYGEMLETFDSREFTVPVSARSMSGYVALHRRWRAGLSARSL